MAIPDQSLIATRASRVRRRFYVHLAVFVLVNALLVAVNLLTNPGQLWIQWPLLGWGLGLALHAFFFVRRADGTRIRDRMLAREQRKLARRQPAHA